MSKTDVNVVEASKTEAPAQSGSTEQAVNGVSHQNVIKKLIADGAKAIKSVQVKNVNFTEKDEYTMISLTLAAPIRGRVSKDGGITYEDGLTNTLFTSLYAITGAFKEDEDLAWMANALLEKPQALNLILNGGKVDIIQQFVPAGTEYKNPFSTREDVEPQVYDHDVIINNIYGFKLGGTGLRMADKMADKLLGF